MLMFSARHLPWTAYASTKTNHILSTWPPPPHPLTLLISSINDSITSYSRNNSDPTTNPTLHCVFPIAPLNTTRTRPFSSNPQIPRISIQSSLIFSIVRLLPPRQTRSTHPTIGNLFHFPHQRTLCPPLVLAITPPHLIFHSSHHHLSPVPINGMPFTTTPFSIYHMTTPVTPFPSFSLHPPIMTLFITFPSILPSSLFFQPSLPPTLPFNPPKLHNTHSNTSNPNIPFRSATRRISTPPKIKLDFPRFSDWDSTDLLFFVEINFFYHNPPFLIM